MPSEQGMVTKDCMSDVFKHVPSLILPHKMLQFVDLN